MTRRRRLEGGAGRRADWRFLLPHRRRVRTLIVEGPDRSESDATTTASRWQWLVEDGWTEAVDTSPDPHRRADTVLVGAGADLRSTLRGAAPNATIVVEVPRSIAAAVRPVDQRLAAAGFAAGRRYLVTPGLDAPRRFTPLSGDSGLRWLLGPSPFHRPSRSRVVAVRAAAMLLRTRLGAALFDTVVVAGDAATDVAPGHPLPPGSQDAVLLTSGHDEGSRAILLPLTDDEEPLQAIKISPRPRFNANVDAEVTVIRSLRSPRPASTRSAISNEPPARIGDPTGGRDYAMATILPQILGTFDLGMLRGSRESYAGRWTASDLGFRHPEIRPQVLERVMDAATGLAMATGRPQPWSATMFDTYLGRPFERYAELMGRTDRTDPLVELFEGLVERSDQLTGRPLPLVRRHYDLGPWNVVIGDGPRLTIIDWETAPPRRPDDVGPAGADHLYFIKYWLHICIGTASLDEELSAFEFPIPTGSDGAGRLNRDGAAADARKTVTAALAAALDALEIDRGFVPLLAGHLWLEKALYTVERRKHLGIDPGAAGPYLDALAAHRDRLLAHWPVTGRWFSG